MIEEDPAPNSYICEWKCKKIREEKLVKGYSVTDVEAKVTEKYTGFQHDWRIFSVSESKIDEVID